MRHGHERIVSAKVIRFASPVQVSAGCHGVSESLDELPAVGMPSLVDGPVPSGLPQGARALEEPIRPLVRRADAARTLDQLSKRKRVPEVSVAEICAGPGSGRADNFRTLSLSRDDLLRR
jgi:hypothetical protein